jgi:two-component system response regulator FixJ
MAIDAVVHLIDDDVAVRRAQAFLLTTSGFAVRTYASGSAFLHELATLQPGCIVTDVRMPGISGLELQRALLARNNAMPVIVMTGHGDVSLAVEAMRAGAVDFIEKPFADEVLISAIRIALARYAANALGEAGRAATAARLQALTSRELEVLEGLMAGLANKTIAYDMRISARTVEVHRANVMSKMAAVNLAALMRMILQLRGQAGGS